MFQTYEHAAKEKFVDCDGIPEFENKQGKRKKHLDESKDNGHTFDSNFKINTFYVICDICDMSVVDVISFDDGNV